MNYEHDPRLDKLKPGQYRLWHDGQNILVPVGQSTTKPLTKEIVNANARVYGEINNGYFNPPWVDFTNTNVVTERFDRYKLQTWRDNLPINLTEIDYNKDLGIIAIKIEYSATFTCEEFTGNANGQAWVNFSVDNIWLTETLHFDNYALQGLKGNFFLICNPTAEQLQRGAMFDTGAELQTVNLPITAIVQRATIFNGNSEMPLLLKNPDFPLTLSEFTFNILGGE